MWMHSAEDLTLFGCVDVCFGEKLCVLAASSNVFKISMYCAYPVPGMGSNSLMYYYNGKTVSFYFYFLQLLTDFNGKQCQLIAFC